MAKAKREWGDSALNYSKPIDVSKKITVMQPVVIEGEVYAWTEGVSKIILPARFLLFIDLSAQSKPLTANFNAFVIPPLLIHKLIDNGANRMLQTLGRPKVVP